MPVTGLWRVMESEYTGLRQESDRMMESARDRILGGDVGLMTGLWKGEESACSGVGK